MSELDERFRSLARTRAPDLWAEIGERDPGHAPDSGTGRRIAAAAVALVVATAGFGVAALVLGPLDAANRAAAVANGKIAFAAVGVETWQIFAVEPDGTGLVQLTDVAAPFVVHDPAWSPDGSRLAYVVRESDTDRSDIWVMFADGSGAHPITDGPGSNRGPAWSPDGSRIAFTHGDDIFVMDADGTNVTNLMPERTGPGAFDPTWSPDGEFIAFVGRETDDDLYMMRSDGSDIRTLFGGPGAQREPAWSPDGSTIAFADHTQATESEFGEFTLVDPTGTVVGRLSNLPQVAQAPAWAPDGQQIVFMANVAVADREAIFVMNADGTDVREIPGLPNDASWPAWQPLTTDAPVEPSPMPEPVPVESASVEVGVPTTHDVADFPSAVAVGMGGIWVTACCDDAPQVVRLDPQTGDVVARIPVRATPGWDFGGAGLAVADGSVWIVGSIANDPGCCDAVVTRIDPATNSVVDELTIPGLSDGDVWVDGDAVYVLGFAYDETPLELARVDAGDHSLEWRVPVPGQWSQTVFVAGGSVWVLGTEPDARGPVEVSMLYRLDASTGEVVDQVPLATSATYVPALQADTVWFRGDDGAQRFDAASGTFVGPSVKPAPGCCTGAFVSDGQGGVWVLSSPGAGVDRSIWHIDASGTVVASGEIDDQQLFEELGGQSYAFDPVTQTVWVQHYRDSVSRVELAISSP